MFNPVRAPIQPFTRKEVTMETVEHILATGYESDWRMPISLQNIIENNMHSSY